MLGMHRGHVSTPGSHVEMQKIASYVAGRIESIPVMEAELVKHPFSKLKMCTLAYYEVALSSHGF